MLNSMKCGGVLLFRVFTVHLVRDKNPSGHIRFSCGFRYQARSYPPARIDCRANRVGF